MGLRIIPSDLSEVGIKREATFGTIPASPFRGLPLSTLTAELSTDRAPFTKIVGKKGDFDAGRSAEHWELTITGCLMGSDASMASIIDLVHAIFDLDVVTGVDPYTHTFSIATEVNKKSFSVHHKNGDGDERTFSGFVANTLTINLNKSEGVITFELTGMAKARDNSAQSITVDYDTTPSVWSPVTGKATLNGTQIDMYDSISIEFSCGTEVFNPINDSAAPTVITGATQKCKVTMEGVWSTDGAVDGITFRDQFLNATANTGNLVIAMGPSATDDYLTLTIPLFKIETQTDMDLEADAMLPQTVTLNAVHQGDVATNGHTVAILNTISTDWDTI